MFLANIRCQYRKLVGSNVYGKAVYGPLKSAACGVVRLEEDSDPTSVRADSSASRSSAMEEKITARLLFPAKVQLSQGDMVMAVGRTMVVQSIWPRHNVVGKLDHWQVDLMTMEG